MVRAEVVKRSSAPDQPEESGSRRRIKAQGSGSREPGSTVGVVKAATDPVAALAIRYYLAGFAEHAPFGQWPLLAAVALALLAALAATARHTAVAIRMSPVQALRA
jgi:hypothetical protein